MTRRGLAGALAACALAAGVGCGPGAATHGGQADVRPRLRPTDDHVASIADAATWTRLARGLRERSIADIDEVKFLIDTMDLDARGQPRVYFVDANRYDSHYDFARTHLDRSDRPITGPMEFYVSEYRRPDRRFWLGSIVRYRGANAWTFELLSGDNLAGEPLLAAFELVRSRVYFGDALRVHPLSDLHTQTLASLGSRAPATIDDATLHGGWSYEPIQLGTAYGFVHLVRGHLDPASVRPNQIVVTEGVPDDIPVCAALVTSRFQAPLAHVALLSQNRRTPDAAVRDAVNDARFTALDGRLARLDVTERGVTLVPAELAAAEAHWAQIRPREPYSPRLDAEESALLTLAELSMDDVPRAGAKAANLGDASRLDGVEVPPAFVVPMRYFVEHMQRSGARVELERLLGDDAFRADAGVRAQRLAALRERIANAAVDRALVRRVGDAISTLHAAGRLRFRSSTNAEDLPGFNGAGLYTSVTVAHAPSDAEIASALAQVWASVFNLGAHEEREWYRIDHANVAMAVLVQASVDDGIANGVALTNNPFDPTRPAVFIDAQAMGGSVTGATGDEVPEQFLVLTYLPEREPEVLSRSSRTNGAPILSSRDVLALTNVLVTLHDHFAPRFPEGSNAVDVEFLVAGPEHRPVIVQARPFAIAYRATR